MGGNTAYSANSQNIKKFELQQKARGFFIVLAIALPVFLAMIAYLYYQDATKQKSTSQTKVNNQGSVTLPQSPVGTANPNQPAGSSTTHGGTTGTGNTNGTIQAPSSGMPAGVSAALNSIEANGIKGNPYVASYVDTSPVPVGTSIQFDRNSWTSYSDTMGSINAVASVLGQSKNISITFAVTEGAWKATGYSMS